MEANLSWQPANAPEIAQLPMFQTQIVNSYKRKSLKRKQEVLQRNRNKQDGVKTLRKNIEILYKRLPF